ncbi:anti-sigma factor [Nocardioides jishulii]|uniref:Regulator of SigK n=1 Tax=Nocardioides jishulii TaxID=2575440 RepID=A0A4U2YV28_9ACTN|nr:anti-sigma factor [Nocardioides jishulii]QCX26235.1 anti-sigma factor [Nocardioides jishulii]TKI63961.1 anti-sigma factor [Nocardioides jishulii]
MNDIHLLTGAYALDALDPDERARFEAHVVDCPECAEEVAELRETATMLSELEPVAPPAELRTGILDLVAQVRPLPPEVPHDAPVELSTRRRRRRLPLIAAAAALVIVGAGAGIGVWSPWEANSPSLSAAEQVIAAEDAEREVVDLGEAGRATVVRSVSEEGAVLMTEDMVAPPKGKVYQVWFQTSDDDMVPAGVMEPVPNQTLLLDGPAADATGVGITVEPIGGSKAPTSDPIALFDLAEG